MNFILRIIAYKLLQAIGGIMKIYDLNPSQEVVKLQCKYTLHKRVINILTSISSEKEIDFDVMKQAFNKVVERNDCLRIRFVKQDGKLMQYFLDEDKFDEIPYIEFKTKTQQDKFFDKYKKKAIKYTKGVVVEPYFIKTFDNKYMVLLKICHLILDIYGINVIFKDLFDVYTAMKNNTELPECPTKFEDVVIKDLEAKKNGVKTEKHFEFFNEYLDTREEPYYAGLHGDSLPLWQKQRAKGKRAMKMFFVRNDTTGYLQKIDKETMDKVASYSKENRVSMANLLFYMASITASKMNGNVKNMIPLELCNCRATNLERKCAGTKVQSIGCYTVVEGGKTFKDNLSAFVDNQNQLYRHLDFSDQEFEMMLHRKYPSSMLETYYSITFSFIPFIKSEDVEFNIYSNGKGALPAYLAMLYNVNEGDADMAYDVQDQLMNEQDIIKYHKNYVSVINQIMDNPEIKIEDVKVEK